MEESNQEVLHHRLREGKPKHLKEYTLLRGKLYNRLPREVLSRCLGKEEAKEQLEVMHGEICGTNHVVGLYHRLQRKGYY